MRKGLSAAAARCVIATTLVIGLMPTIAYADDASTTSGDDSQNTEVTTPGETTGGQPSEDEMDPPLNTNIAEGAWGGASWVIDDTGALTVGSGTGANTGGTSPWAAYADSITSIAFEETTAPANCQGLFAGLSHVTSIDLSGLDTSAATSMASMFANCSALAALDLSDVDTAHVTTMANMFSGCFALTTLDLSSFSTSRVVSMTDMFQGCGALTTLDLSSIDTSAATNMTGMFDGCNVLSQVTVGASFSFKGATSAVLAELPSSFDAGTPDWYSTNELTWYDADEIAAEHNNVFTMYCKDDTTEPLVDPNDPGSSDDPLKEPVSGTWESSSWTIGTDGKLVISGALPNVTSQTEVPWTPYASNVTSVSFSGTVTASQSLVGLFGGLSNVTSINLTGLDTSNTTSLASLFSGCRSLKAIDLEPLDTGKVTNMSRMFNGCSSLTSIDLSSLDGSSVTNLGGMFRRCSSLASVNFDGFDTSHVTYMAGMFYGCAMLKSFDLASLDMSANTTLSEMFAFCTSLEIVSFRDADTSKVTRMDSMFNGCSSLAGIDFANIDTARVTRMDYLFSGCSSLATVVASSLSTRSVTTMERMFSGCESLLTLDLTSFNTSKVTNMSNMFNGCSSLHDLTLGFSTPRVTSTAGMFYGCQYLTELDLSSFTTASVTDMHDMFAHCTYLQHLDISGFNTSKASNMADMFDGCTLLSCVKVGSRFTFSGTADEPQCQLPAVSWSWGTSDWYSTSDGTWLSSDTIAQSEVGKATTYQKATTAPAVISYPVSGENLTFSDVDYMDWYGPAVSYVSSRDIIKGYEDTSLFGVGNTMTRAEFAVVLCRLFGEDSSTDDSYPANATGLADVEDHVWYTEAANWAVANGIIAGVDHEDGSKTFEPNEPLSFEQMIVIVSRCADAPTYTDPASLDRFSDGQSVSDWARSSMAWAVNEGIVSGYSGIELRPAEAVSRERGATIITNCCLLGYLA